MVQESASFFTKHIFSLIPLQSTNFFDTHVATTYQRNPPPSMKLAAITTLMFFAALTSAKEHMPEEFQCMGACKISGEVQCIGTSPPFLSHSNMEQLI
jgi:hypothetical protein